MIVDIDALKLKVEQLKFKGGDEPEDVATWSHTVEEQIAEVDVEITFLEKSLEEVRSKADLQKREKELALTARASEEQLEFERAQLELKLEYERKLEESRAGKISVKASHKEHAKLPKLKMTKFNGTYANWLRFGTHTKPR